MTPGTYTLAPVSRGDTWIGIGRFQRQIQSTALTVASSDSTDAFTLIDHGLANGDAVMVTGAGLSASAIYYVVSGAADTFQVATTAGGTFEALTTAATVLVYPLAAPATPVASARIQFRLDEKDGPLVLELTSADDGGLVIEDADTWEFSVPERLTGFSRSGTLYWDLECTDDDGAVVTWVEGTIAVLPDVTR